MPYHFSKIIEDNRFIRAVDLFNLGKWYEAHDAFEEIWHESNEPERKTLQGFLQVSVAQLHLERGNFTGAVILYGEGLGRLRLPSSPDLGIDIDKFCKLVEKRLILLQAGKDVEGSIVPTLVKK